MNKVGKVFDVIGWGIVCLIGYRVVVIGVESLSYGGALSAIIAGVGLFMFLAGIIKIKNLVKQEPEIEMEIEQIDHEQRDMHKPIPDNDKRVRTTSARIIIAVILGFIAVAGIALGVLSGIIRFAIAGIMVGILAIMVWGEDKKHIFHMVAVLVLYVLVMSFIQVVSLHSTCAWIYPFQSAYIGTLRNTVEPEWFPDQWEDIVSDFHFDYCMSWMDPGYYAVSYNTTSEHVLELEEIYAPISEKAHAEALERDGEKAIYNYDNIRVFQGVGDENNVVVSGGYKEFLELKDCFREETGADTVEYYMVYIIDYRNCHSIINNREYKNQSKCGVLIIDVVEDSSGEMTCSIEFNSI